MNNSKEISSLSSAILVLFLVAFASTVGKAMEISGHNNDHQNLTTIQGHVTDETGNPISGAILTVKWTEREARSDVNGEFKIENVSEKDTIVVKHPGYYTVEFAVERLKLNYFISLKIKGKVVSLQPGLSSKSEKMDITGRIYDDKGAPLPDATLVVKGENQGGSTNNNGEFNLPQVPVNSKMTITHISFFSEEFTVKKGESNYQLSLRKNPMLLNEVVIVGYGYNGHGSRNKGFKLSEKQATIVEQNPEFPGGTEALYKFLAQNINYPTEASSNNIAGRLFISFIVNADGKIRKPQIIKGLGWGIDEEVLRVVLNMPLWVPAIQNGKPISMEFTLPFNFTLE